MRAAPGKGARRSSAIEQRQGVAAALGAAVVGEVEGLGDGVAVAASRRCARSRAGADSDTTSTMSSMIRVRSKSFGV